MVWEMVQAMFWDWFREWFGDGFGELFREWFVEMVCGNGFEELVQRMLQGNGLGIGSRTLLFKNHLTFLD